MKRRIRGLGAVLAAGATVVAGAAFVPAAVAAPADDSQPSAAQRPDNRPGPLTERQNERRKAAQELILSGQAAPNEDGVVALAEGDKYYEATLDGHGAGVHDPLRVRRPGQQEAGHSRRARCTTRSLSPTAR